MSDPEPGTTLPRRVLWTAPALLVLTALAQIVLTRAGPLTPWRGGGFGLFSTVDRLENRILLAWIETPEGDAPLRVEGRAYDEQNALAFPIDRHLRRVAERYAASLESGTGVRVEVWKRTFDPSTGESRRVLVASRTVPRAR